jgi:hypothetical protein
VIYLSISNGGKTWGYVEIDEDSHRDPVVGQSIDPRSLAAMMWAFRKIQHNPKLGERRQPTDMNRRLLTVAEEKMMEVEELRKRIETAPPELVDAMTEEMDRLHELASAAVLLAANSPEEDTPHGRYS